MSLAFRKKFDEIDDIVSLRKAAVVETQKRDFGPSRTKQSEKAACDINNIVARYKTTGFVDHLNKRPAQFLDVSEVNDYRSALDQVTKANVFFMGLPAKVRARFDNDPARFLDEAGQLSHDELKELGLAELNPPKPEKAKAAPPVEEPPPAA